MIKYLSFLLVFYCSVVRGEWIDVYNATCKITTPRTGGSGIAFSETDDDIQVLSAAHVISKVKDKEEVFDDVEVEFFSNGVKSNKIKAKRIWHKFKPTTETDICILNISKKDFGTYKIPKVIPLAAEDYKNNLNDVIISSGCPHGAWPSIWTGSITKEGDVLHFVPNPIPGRSGSGLFDKEGKQLIGILIWKNFKTHQGAAVSHKMIHDLRKEK